MAILLIVLPLVVARVLKQRRPDENDLTASASAPVLSPDDLAKSAGVQARRAGEFIDRVRDPKRRAEFAKELSRLHTEGPHELSTLNVVVFGTVSAGKTSLINALIGQDVGISEAVMGTTRHGESHTYQIRSVDALVELTDTPGMSEASEAGEAREIEARSLAARADLLLFVVDYDLIRSEYSPLIELARLGKRSIVVLNKKDRFPDDDLAAILGKVRERLSGIIDPADVVPAAAAPRPLPVRMPRPDGSFETVLEKEEPEVATLLSRMVEVLRREGKLLRAANLLVRGRILEQEAQQQIAAERAGRALEIVEEYQWLTAATVFANPIPAFDILAGGAVQLEMIADLARVHGLKLTAGQVRSLAAQMVQSLLKLGLIEAATSLIAGVFKRTFVGFAAGGAVQAVTMAYLTRVSGKAFVDYFSHGQSWSAGGIDETLLRQFDQTSRSEFLQEFTSQFVHRLLKKFYPGTSPVAASPNRKGDR
jgi:small GTP-binding protein